MDMGIYVFSHVVWGRPTNKGRQWRRVGLESDENIASIGGLFEEIQEMDHHQFSHPRSMQWEV